MAETPEAKVKRFIDKRILDAFPDAWRYRPPGTMFGRAGIPDHFFLWHGVFFVIEAKVDDVGATPLQMKRLQEIKAAGGIAAVVSGKDERKIDLIIAAVRKRADEYASGLQFSQQGQRKEADGSSAGDVPVLPEQPSGVRPIGNGDR